MKKCICLFMFFSALSTSFYAQHVGVGTEDPQAMLDINGDVIFRTADIPIIDSITLSLDVNALPFSRYRIVGADSAFAIAGISAGMDGRAATFINHTGFPMQLNHEDTMAAIPDRIITGNQLSMVLNDMGTVTMQYDTSAHRWVVNSSNIVAQESVWDTAGTNIFFQNYVGIGTEEPTSPLTIETGLNETGFTHMAMSGEDSIKLESSISDVGAAIGTTSDDIFSLNAGGTGKLHVWPDGRVVIGDDVDPVNFSGGGSISRTMPTEAKLTLETPLNSTGWMHIGGPDSIIIGEAIGGISAAIGTYSNHAFRLTAGPSGKGIHLYPDGNAVVGTSVQGSAGRLTVHTPNNSEGIAHVSDGGIVLRTAVGDVSALIGTLTEHAFRLTAGAAAKGVHIYPDGNVVVGISSQGSFGKLTVHTPNDSDGIAHYSSGGILLKTIVGGTSAGFGTFTNHKMRIFANGISVINIAADGNIGMGLENPLAGYKLSVNGNIKAKELVIETVGWPDYVFTADYESLSLIELEKFIRQHHHLPNIPSATEIEESGIAVGDMQKKMMEKIEELTLHIIALNKRIESLENSKGH